MWMRCTERASPTAWIRVLRLTTRSGESATLISRIRMGHALSFAQCLDATRSGHPFWPHWMVCSATWPCRKRLVARRWLTVAGGRGWTPPALRRCQARQHGSEPSRTERHRCAKGKLRGNHLRNGRPMRFTRTVPAAKQVRFRWRSILPSSDWRLESSPPLHRRRTGCRSPRRKNRAD